jgi:plastocyanin
MRLLQLIDRGWWSAMKTRTSFIGMMASAAVAILMLTGCDQRVALGPVADAASATKIREAFASKEAASEKVEAKPTGTGWATISGQITYDGAPPEMAPYNVTKEAEVCDVGGKAPLQETLLVDAKTKGIKNVVIFLRDASRVHESAAPKKDSIDFDQKHCVFLTHVVGVTVGETVNIKNSDPIGHNTNIVGTGFNPTVPAGGSVPYPVQKEASVPYSVKCGIHPWMTAYMLSRKNGYWAVTDAEGKFTIPNVPAGEPLEFQVWHEGGTAAGNGLVGTTPEAKDVKWSNRGRMSITLQPDEKKDIKVVVPAKAIHG